MAIVTSQQLQNYYELYNTVDITFTKEVVKGLGFINEQVYLKILGGQWPCVIYSTSLSSAKIILSLRPDQMDRLRQGSNMVSLRYSFRLPDKTEPLSFFVAAKIKGFNRYNNTSQNLYFMSLEFTQRPPDDLIELIGRFLEVNVNSKKRREERIPVNEQVLRKIGIKGTNTLASVQGLDRKCLLRDISFGGAKILLPGVAKFLADKPVTLKMEGLESLNTFDIPGHIVRVEEVEGRRDITLAAIAYEESQVPLEYKRLINDYLNSLRKTDPAKG